MPDMQQKYRAGLAHLEAKRLNSAEFCFRAVVESEPGFALGHYHLGLVLRLRKEWRSACHAFRSALKVAPELARAHAALGSVLDRMGQVDEAETELRKAIALDSELNFAYILLGDLLRSRGDLGAARAVYETVLAKHPNDPDARFGRGFLSLLEGDLASGWSDYEYRLDRRGRVDPALMPQWRGEDPAGKTLLLYAEQGIGDTIQFLRYAPFLAKKGATVIVAVPVSVMELASRMAGVHEVARPSLMLPRFDACAPLPSLPWLCKTTLSEIPWDGPYLWRPSIDASPERSDRDAKFTVALAWAGNPDHPNDHNRSLPVSELKPLLQTQNVRWLIVQRGAGASELDRMSNVDIVQMGNELNGFSAIAAALRSVDLVISVDTALCHLAGALGKPVWTLLSYAADWRWLLQRSDTPWYPSMRLFRQSSPRNWTGVIAAVSQALADRLTGFG